MVLSFAIQLSQKNLAGIQNEFNTPDIKNDIIN